MLAKRYLEIRKTEILKSIEDYLKWCEDNNKLAEAQNLATVFELSSDHELSELFHNSIYNYQYEGDKQS